MYHICKCASQQYGEHLNPVDMRVQSDMDVPFLNLRLTELTLKCAFHKNCVNTTNELCIYCLAYTYLHRSMFYRFECN